MALKRPIGKVVIVSQHYAPDQSATASIITAIATHLARAMRVLVLCGTSSASPHQHQNAGEPVVITINTSAPNKTALSRRALSDLAFSVRVFFELLIKLRRGDVILTVTAPFVLPYAVTAAAILRGGRTILVLHDFYPDVLVMAGILKPTSIVTKAIHAANSLMFRRINSIVIIGRDMEYLLMRYKGMTREKMTFIPNWATLIPGVRPIVAQNIYRSRCKASFVVGLSGNLGFTHDPDVVFDAAVLLKNDSNIQFLLSGWGMGFENLKARQAQTGLPNITLIDRVPEEHLEEFLSAADIWIIPYRKNVAGVSVPSRFYNLLAIGRPVLIISESNSEAALTVSENHLGWVVRPGDSNELGKAIQLASTSGEISMIKERAAAMAAQFNMKAALAKYQDLVEMLLQMPN
jgi:colanic acid biosynthesis glycosyl transferase WcaI